MNGSRTRHPLRLGAVEWVTIGILIGLYLSIFTYVWHDLSPTDQAMAKQIVWLIFTR